VSSLTSRATRLLGTCACTVALGLATTACGGAPAAPSASSPSAAPSAPSSAAAAASHAAAGHAAGGHTGHGGAAAPTVELYAVQTGTLGVVVTDGEGRLLYGSDQDANNPPTSNCADACTQEWLPLVVPAGEEPDLLGVTPGVVGRLTRADGSSQLTMSGWPVYVNKNDDGGLKSAAPDAHGTWFVMTPEGQKVPV